MDEKILIKIRVHSVHFAVEMTLQEKGERCLCKGSDTLECVSEHCVHFAGELTLSENGEWNLCGGHRYLMTRLRLQVVYL
jgi:hypothetical protein